MAVDLAGRPNDGERRHNLIAGKLGPRLQAPVKLASGARYAGDILCYQSFGQVVSVEMRRRISQQGVMGRRDYEDGWRRYR